MPTLKDLLLQQFEAAINATFGDKADEKIPAEAFEQLELQEIIGSYTSSSDIDYIASKVKFYLELDKYA